MVPGLLSFQMDHWILEDHQDLGHQDYQAHLQKMWDQSHTLTVSTYDAQMEISTDVSSR